MKSICKMCGGRSLCIHGTQKAVCKECIGSAVCIHGGRKNECKACGTYYCQHQKAKYKCGICKAERAEKKAKP